MAKVLIFDLIKLSVVKSMIFEVPNMSLFLEMYIFEAVTFFLAQ